MTEHDKPQKEESFASLMAQTDASRKSRLVKGQKIEARVVGIGEADIFLDVGEKSEGYIAKAELLDQDGELQVAVGDTIKVYFLAAKQGEKLFTTRIGSGRQISVSHLEAALDKGVPVEGLIEKEIKGGFEVKLAGNIRAFCPYSQLGLYRVEDTGEYVGQKHNFLIMELSENGRNIVVSRRALLERERLRQKEELRNTLTEGTVVRGKVTSIRDFGAFVDIGGVDGLIPVSEIGWSRVDDINEYLQVGQEVEVAVLSLDWEKNRIGLSLKQTLADPWSTAEEKFPPQTHHTGTVSQLAKFGAFVTLAPGIDGLLHISKLGDGRKINHAKEAVAIGQTLEVRIESVDKNSRRISLDLAANPAEAEQEAADDDITAYLPSEKAKEGGLNSLGDLLQAKLREKAKKNA
jgi:small subunit ribosomal protein S1